MIHGEGVTYIQGYRPYTDNGGKCNCAGGKHALRPTVHKCCAYGIHAPAELPIANNGVQMIAMPEESKSNSKIFKETLISMVKRTNRRLPEYVKGTQKCLSGLDTGVGWKGIILERSTYQDILEDLLKEIEDAEGVTFTKEEYSRHAAPVKDYIRLKWIKWKFK